VKRGAWSVEREAWSVKRGAWSGAEKIRGKKRLVYKMVIQKTKSGEYSRNTNFVQDYTELTVYKLAFKSATRIYELSKKWPTKEKYSLIDQVLRSSRSVCGNIAEAWRKRRYQAHFAPMYRGATLIPSLQRLRFGLTLL